MDLSNHHRDHPHPSFSSSLLDQIYRSLDNSSPNSNFSMRNKKHHHHHHHHHNYSLHQNSSCQTNNYHASYLDKNQSSSSQTYYAGYLDKKRLAEDFFRSNNSKTSEQPVFYKHSSSSSSDSSGFSSSESDSFYIRSRSSRSPPEIPPYHPHPKPIRTTTVERSSHQEHGSFLRTKSKALKIYTELKKAKQPISPGGRLSTFLNSLFTSAGNTKKPAKTNKAASTTTCSSASSFSRSCLSKTPSSTERSKRSVRFCPVNVVILDQDKARDEPTPRQHQQNFDSLVEENRRVMEAARELLRIYDEKNKDDDDEEDDAASCASSDLFELDNLSAIGTDKYSQELPVYETTRLDTTVSK